MKINFYNDFHLALLTELNSSMFDFRSEEKYFF